MSFTEFVSSFLSSHVALLISSLSLAVSLRSSHIARRSLKLSEQINIENKRLRASAKRAELLKEIDAQNAKFGTLLAILAEGVILFNESTSLIEQYPDQYDRLKKNLEAVQSLRVSYEEQRQNAEKLNEYADVSIIEAALAEIKSLTIHIEEDITKEKRGIELLVSKIKQVRPV